VNAHALTDALDTWSRRLARRRGLRRAGRVTALGMTAVALFVAVASLVPIPAGPLQSPVNIALLATGLVLLAAVGAVFSARFSREDAAQVADLRQNNGTLFTTAWDAHQRAATDQPLSDAENACLAHAVEACGQVSDAEIVPIRFGWRWGTAALYLLAAAFLYVPFATDTAQAVENDRLNAAAVELHNLEKRLDELPAEAATLDPALRKQLGRLSQRLETRDIDAKEAMQEIGELNRKLRAEKLTQRARADQKGRAAREAANELGRSQSTSQLAQQLADGSRSEADAAERKDAADKAANELRELKKLSKEQRDEAANALDKGAAAARKAGDERLGQMLESASKALQSGDDAQLDKAADELEQAIQQAGDGQQSVDQVAEALQRAQQRLAGVDPGDGQGRDAHGRTGRGQISPGQRDWKPGGNGPGQGPAAAGKGHSDTEAPAYAVGDKHNDSDRSNADTPDAWETDFHALYESANLDDSLRVLTQVKGEKSGDSNVGTVRGGQQAPSDERARKALEQLPVRYARDAQDAVRTETIPPGYRDAVKDYFNPAH